MYSIRTWLYLDWDSESIVLITGYLALGGGFIHIFFLNFYPDPWEDSIQFDFRIFFRRVGSTTNQLKPPTHMTDGKSRFEDAFPVGKWRFCNVRLVFRGMFLAFGQLSIHKCHGSSLVPKALWLAQGFGAKVQVALLASLIEKHPPPNPCFFVMCVCQKWTWIWFFEQHVGCVFAKLGSLYFFWRTCHPQDGLNMSGPVTWKTLGWFWWHLWTCP